MNSDVPQPRLDLLSPWDLPIDQPLEESDRAKVEQALQQFLQALSLPDQEAIALLDRAISALGTPQVSAAGISVSKTALNQQQIEDFDGYFDVYHVRTEEPAICLVRGILVTYRRSLQLQQQQKFNSAQIAEEKQGFISYARLLMRVFDLEETQ